MTDFYKRLDNIGAILLAVIWISPLVFAFWAAFHTTSDAVSFNLLSSWTLDNFRVAWEGAPWIRYFLNTFCFCPPLLLFLFYPSYLFIFLILSFHSSSELLISSRFI